jgi:bacterioferritin-associated ferredoxin
MSIAYLPDTVCQAYRLRVSSSEKVVCRCLKVTEEKVMDAIQSGEACTLREICRRTGAGRGCNACHSILRHYLQMSSERVPEI